MSRKQIIVVGVLLALSLFLSGCKKKKPPLPAQAQAPTLTDSAGVPETIPEVVVPEPAAEPPQPSKPAPSVARKPRPRPAPKTEAKKAPPAQPATPAVSDKVVIDEGLKEDPAPPPLVANQSTDQAARQRMTTNQLIGATEYNINNISRALSGEEQAIVQHIRGFIEQSRQALKDGDTERAYTLATKAHLMSDALAKK